MPTIKELGLVLLVVQMLCITTMGYVVLPLNQKPNVTIEDRHNQFKRANEPLGGGMTRVGYYFVLMTIGSQTFQIDIDTGSSTLYVVGGDCHYLDSPSTPCTYARSYYQGNAPYAGCNSGCNDCQKNTCIMKATYGDGSQVYGAVKNELVSLGGYSATAPVAISYLQSSSFANVGGETHMDGLWGMAYPVLNGGNPTVIDQLVNSGMPNVFSMCFNEPAVGNAGGYLVMGGIDTSMHTGTVQYTPITSFDYYSIGVSDLRVGSTALSLTFPSTFVDSGTTFTYMPNNLYISVKAALRNAGMSSNWFTTPSDGIPCSPQVITALPTITYVFPKVGGGTFTVALSPSQYTIPCTQAGYRAFGIIPTNDNTVILGDTFMRASNTVFDRAHNQVGFAPVSSNCNGAIPVNTDVKTVPGTKSQFSSASIFFPSQFYLLVALLVIFIMN